jgi:5'-3' exonuclease
MLKVHLIDGTFDLFRAWFGAPPARVGGREVGASRGLLRSLAALLRSGQISHAGIAFDHVIESFRNRLFAGYKTGDGLDPELYGQFELAEQVAAALGLATWPMIEFEADDALATAAAALSARPEVDQVVIVSPDKDLTQCVRGSRVVTWDRMRDKRLDEDGVVARFGVGPGSIPDLLALVGDPQDGIPGLPRWGARSAAAVLARWRHIDEIPDDATRWEVAVRGRAALADVLREHRTAARLYRLLATLRSDAPIDPSLAALAWRGVDTVALAAVGEQVGVEPSSLALPSR